MSTESEQNYQRVYPDSKSIRFQTKAQKSNYEKFSKIRENQGYNVNIDFYISVGINFRGLRKNFSWIFDFVVLAISAYKAYRKFCNSLNI